MQHYMCFGYGFISEKLTKEEFKKVRVKISEDDEIGADFISYTEDDVPSRGWSVLLLEHIKEIPNSGKAITLSEWNEKVKKYGEISKQSREYFLEVLTHLEIPHLIDQVELIIYSNNY